MFEVWCRAFDGMIRPDRQREFKAQLAILFKVMGRPIEVPKPHKYQAEFDAAIDPDEIEARRREVEESWTEAQRQSRREGIGLESQVRFCRSAHTRRISGGIG